MKVTKMYFDGTCYLEMYALKLVPAKKIRVCCERCSKAGEVDPSCTVCGGKGVHVKSQGQEFKVMDDPVSIIKIDRDEKDGMLRYWESTDTCYREEVNHNYNQYVPEEAGVVHFIHFSRADAVRECARVNLRMQKAKAEAEALKNMYYGNR